MNSNDNNSLNTIKNDIKTIWDKAVEFHGHSCPGLAYGVRAGLIALEKLNAYRAEDEELVAIPETDSCSVDGIQVVTGCTLGKGNLILKDYGKSVFSFALRKNGKAVRIVMKAGEKYKPDNELHSKVMNGQATQEEKELYKKMRQKRIQYILEGPEEEVSKVEWVNIKLPERAKIFNSIQCEKCGEYFMEARGRLENGKKVCLECFEEYSRRW